MFPVAMETAFLNFGSFCILEAQIPPGIAFMLATQCKETGNKQHEITNRTLAYPTRNVFHWLPLGLALAIIVTLVIIGLRWALLAHVGQYFNALGVALGTQGFLDPNMLVLAT